VEYLSGIEASNSNGRKKLLGKTKKVNKYLSDIMKATNDVMESSEFRSLIMIGDTSPQGFKASVCLIRTDDINNDEIVRLQKQMLIAIDMGLCDELLELVSGFVNANSDFISRIRVIIAETFADIYADRNMPLSVFDNSAELMVMVFERVMTTLKESDDDDVINGIIRSEATEIINNKFLH